LNYTVYAHITMWHGDKARTNQINKLVLIATAAALLFLTIGKSNAEPSHLTFKCDEPPIEFTLGENSNPSKADLNKLCNCINEKFSAKSKQTNLNMKNKKISSKEDTILFMNEFRNAMQTCGALSL